ncbi:hypothetical protein [Enterovirga sp. CN4-39]|uniref:hypothetical protein n=1 Tax=Enterovirga sp. CN4-39 TaxID=3400910 RepID=UPI003C0D1B89
MSREGPENGYGKWGQAGVPHRGWTCDDIEDLGELAAVCEMCEAQEIRYVHHMSHPRYGGTLACGCVCAGHMEGDPSAAADRDKRMRNAAARRARWLSRKGWRVSQNGNPTIRAYGYRVTVFSRAGAWAASVAPLGGEPIFSKRRWSTLRAAKLAAFDKIVQLGE